MTYIDREKLYDDIKENVCACYGEEQEIKNECLGRVGFAETADVVPRSEVEEIVKFKDMAYAELKSLFVEAKQEVETWKANCEQLYKEMSERIMEERKIERKLAKQEVAKAIFEKLSTIFKKYEQLYNNEICELLLEDLGTEIAELKKYIGE